MDAKAMHEARWRIIEANGIRILHNARCTGAAPGEQGFFHPNLYGYGPAIQLWRDRADTVDDYSQELVTLAHEYGHGISYSRGQRPRIDMPAAAPNLTEAEKNMVEAEEARAWEYGREELRKLDTDYDLSLFEARKRDADAAYARLLGR